MVILQAGISVVNGFVLIHHHEIHESQVSYTARAQHPQTFNPRTCVFYFLAHEPNVWLIIMTQQSQLMITKYTIIILIFLLIIRYEYSSIVEFYLVNTKTMYAFHLQCGQYSWY